MFKQEMSKIFFSSQIDQTAFRETAFKHSKVQSKQTPEHKTDRCLRALLIDAPYPNNQTK